MFQKVADKIPSAEPVMQDARKPDQVFAVTSYERQTSLDVVRARDAHLRVAYQSSRPAVLVGIGILAVFFGSIVVWLACIPLRADINVPGEIVFKNKRQSVQHLEGGIVKEILVHDGDTVRAGQPLIRLESSQVLPLVNMLEEQGAAEVAYMARVDAESKDQSDISFPASLTGRAGEPSVARIMQTERRLFAARRAAFEHQVQLLRQQIVEIRESIKGTVERLAAKNQEIATVKEQLEANQALQKQGYVTNTVVLDLQRTMASHTGERQALVASIASEKERIIEFEQRILAVKAERVQGAVNEMKQAALRRIDAQERVRPLRDTLERQVIRAPVSGKVVGLKVATVGGIIMPREPLMEIAPVGEQLVVEAKVRLEDISEVKVGQVADVNVSGIHLRTRPQVKARVTYVSDDRVITPTAQGPQGVYPALLELDQESLKTLGGIQLKPGMSVSAAIATKPRTPITDMMESVRERFDKALVTR